MSRPNLLFILTDQQRYDTLACYGNSQIHTPHLNRLADESLVLEHAYVTQPVCSPARASLMTGLYPHACGVTRCNIITPDRWKLNLSAYDPCELYDLTTDPAELTNLFDDSKQQDRVDALTRFIVEWQATFSDSAPLP